MKINAYILAADPAWIEASVLSYYDLVERIVVSYDRDSKGWTGAPIDVEQCLCRLRAIDRSGKFDFRPGHFARPEFFNQPMANDTNQRQVALNQASEGADWVLQLDTDEVVTRLDRVVEVIEQASGAGHRAIEWPMRVLFRRTHPGSFLEICASCGGDRFEYPGPVAIKPGAKLRDARRADGPFLRVVARGDNRSLQIRGARAPGETRLEAIEGSEAIIHNSWGRSPASIRSKIASWGHNQGWRSKLFYHLVWKPSPVTWRALHNFHPLCPPLWPALRPCPALPAATARLDDQA